MSSKPHIKVADIASFNYIIFLLLCPDSHRINRKASNNLHSNSGHRLQFYGKANNSFNIDKLDSSEQTNEIELDAECNFLYS
jgi:hypothetical protein